MKLPINGAGRRKEGEAWAWVLLEQGGKRGLGPLLEQRRDLTLTLSWGEMGGVHGALQGLDGRRGLDHLLKPEERRGCGSIQEREREM